jgi:protein-S-isoprenylcysteine O-methyltransferase Ste14
MRVVLIVIYASWVAWLLSWLIASIWSARTAARASLREEMPYRLLQLAGAALVFYGPIGHGWPAWTVDEWAGWPMAALTVAGFLFAWWARLHLGRLWSGTVQRKEGHRLVDTGPYRFVRHPIYTGLLLSIFATAIARAGLVPLVGAGVMTFAWYLKARLEESLLRAELGADAYDAYAGRTPMLLPLPLRGDRPSI